MSLHIYPTWSPNEVLVYTSTWWRRMNRDDVFASLDLLRAAYSSVVVHLDPW